MKTVLALVLLALSGCTTTMPRSVGPDSYEVEVMGTNMTVGPATAQATAFCAAMNKKALILTTGSAGVLLSARGYVTFKCVDAG